MVARPWACLALAATLLSGCTGGKSPAADPQGGEPGLEETLPIDPSAPVEAPQWAPGQWWEWETSFGDQVADYTFCSIVLSADGGDYQVVTEVDTMAKNEAAYGHPLLGAIDNDLGMAGWGGDWDLLSFPLEDGKAWTASMPNIAWDIVPEQTVELAMEATLDAELGEAGGFRIVGKVDDAVLMEAEYDLVSGWFSGLRFYDVDPGQEELEVGFRAKAVGANYTGPYFHYTGEVLVDLFDGVGFTDDPTQGGEPFAQPNPHATFTMSEGSLYGILAAENVLGGRAMTLTDPDGQQRQVVSTGTLDGDYQELPIDEPGIPGEWRLVTTGAGGYSGGFAFLAELTDLGGTM